MLRHVDSHSHLQFPQFDDDREEVLSRMREMGISTIAVGTDFLTSRAAVQLALDVPDVVLGATVGVHPTHCDEGFNAEHFEGLWKTHGTNLVVGVGECGLDYFHRPKEEVFGKQCEAFEQQIAFAIEHDLPLMLHVRPTKGSDDAHNDALSMLTPHIQTHGARVRGTAHFFTGSLEAAQKYWNLGFATSFPGVVTFVKELEEVVRAAPENLILAETDAPYAAPLSQRGKRNEPAFVEEIVTHIARIRGEEVGKIAGTLINNTQRIFLTHKNCV